MSRTELGREVVEAQREVMRELLGATLGDLLEVDLTMAQMKALAVIQRKPNCTIGTLSEQLGVKPPATSLLVDKLVRAGLARRLRDRNDGRRVIVESTVEGSNLISRIRHGGHAVLESWVAQLSEDDLMALNRGIRELAAVARAFPLQRSAGQARAVEA